MKLTALTCTFNRPEAFALCKRYMAAQSRAPDQWLILDGPEPMRVKVRQAALSGAIEGDAVVFFEDDDFLKPDWLEWCESQIAKGYQLVGEGRMVYYNVAHRFYMECENRQHAALGATCMSTKLLEELVNVIDAYETPFFDRRLWHLQVNKLLHIPQSPTDRRVVGIKGMPGTPGYSSEHRDMPEWGRYDPGLDKLEGWIGTEGAKTYAQYHLAPMEAPQHPEVDVDEAPPIAERLPPTDHRPAGPLVAVVQYWDGDEAEANRLIKFLKANHAIYLLTVVPYLSHGVGYPKGPNEAAMNIIRQAPDRWPNAAGVLLMEPDCVPVSPTWVLKLMEAWSRARAAGKLVMGSWRPVAGPWGHINGNMLFDPFLAEKVTLPDVPEDKAWDVFLAPQLVPVSARTGLIRNLWRERWVPRARLTTPECGDQSPVLIHGLSDEGAWDLAKENFK